MGKKEARYVLGIYQGHNSTVCLMQNGEIVFAVSEERLSRKKNDGSIPIKGLTYCIDYLGISKEDIKTVVFNSVPLESTVAGIYDTFLKKLLKRKYLLMYILTERLYLRINDIAVKIFWYNFVKENRNKISRFFDKKTTVLYYPNHHTLHAYAGLYFSGFPQDVNDCLIFTCDGEGHDTSATVSLYREGKIDSISSINYSTSLGHFYEAITEYLGMKKMEHEYKVMGLAPYSEDAPQVAELVNKISSIFYFEGNDFRSKIHSANYPWFIKKICRGYRFDYIASAAQKIIEEILIKWIRNYTRDYNIKNVVLSGGVFMNVKANMEVTKIPEIEKVFIMPSCADESIALGAAVYGEVKNDVFIKTPQNLYLGMEYSEAYIDDVINRIDKTKYKVEKVVEIENNIASLLKDGNIVAHFSGRMEWGARALGNRSIFANASEPHLLYRLNKMIKSRDFWMPFAPAILKEDADRYISTPDWRKVNTDSMMCAFEATQVAQKHLYCAMHPYDKTIRAQIVTSQLNQRFYTILKKYKELTGMGGFLNTSFNLHGYPIVCSPEDALYVFEKTDLEYLVIENFLIKKINKK